MDSNVLFAVAVIWGMAAVTPGPNFFITAHTAVDSSRRSSLFTVSGIVFGTLIWSVSGFLGISILFKTVPILYYTIKLIGGFYLIYVGLSLIVKKKHQPVNKDIKGFSAGMHFRKGLLTNLLNPKTAIFMTGLFAATIPPSATLTLGASCVIIICLISATWYSIVATVFSHHMAKILYEKKKHIVEKIAGTIFVAFGIKLAASR